MGSFFQAAAVVLVAVILIFMLQKQGKETALLLSIFVCTMVGLTAANFLQPVITFLEKLSVMGEMDSSMLQTLLKIVGISLTAEIASLICSDSGNGALGKMLQFLASVVVLWLSLPMLTALLDLIEGIMGKV